MRPPRRGDVWLAQLDKVRPVIILTRDPMGRLLHAVVTAPVTSTVRGLSTEVPVGPADGQEASLPSTSFEDVELELARLTDGQSRSPLPERFKAVHDGRNPPTAINEECVEGADRHHSANYR